VSLKKSPPILFAILLVVGGFAIGYVAPHGHRALAQAVPTPTPTPFRDSVPGGFHATGKVDLNKSQGVTYAGANRPTVWTPCGPRPGEPGTCTVEVYYLDVDTSKPTPQPSPCPSQDSCISFTGRMEIEDPVARTGPVLRNAAGTIVISP
jgi:hypothetical protein